MKNFSLYAITDRAQSKSKDLVEIVESLAKGGADVIQLREKQFPTREFVKIGLKLRKITRCFKSLLIVNDRVDVAYAIDADGVHLGQDDLPASYARKIVGRKKLIGMSTHSLRQASAAERARADYIGVGPVFITPTKPEYKPVGLGLISKVRQAIRIPFVCIGGINIKNLESVIESGASRVAVVRALMNADDICDATRCFRDTLLSLVKKHKR